MKEGYTEKIDRTLRRLGSAAPLAGMEDRILARLAQAGTRRDPARFFNFPRLAFTFAVAGTICGFIVAGSVSHSHHILPIAPGLHLPGEAQPGVGAASATRVTPQPVTASPKNHPRSVLKTEDGRAVISPDAKKRAGVAAVPKAPPEQPTPEPAVEDGSPER